MYAKQAYPQYDISSSGVDAAYPPHHLSPLSKIVAATSGFDPTTSRDVTRLEQPQASSSDILVFFDASVYRDARNRLAINPDKAVIWNIKDFYQVVPAGTSMTGKLAHTASIDTFQQIKLHIDELIESIKHQSWTDIVDDHNQLLGYRLPIGWAADRGRWHRGVRALIRTSDGRYVIEKRSDSIIFAPGMLDLSLGGGVDSGEDPLHALHRELAEELGLKVAPPHVTELAVLKWNTYHPRYRKYTRCFVSCYLVDLTTSAPQVHLQAAEVAAAYIMTPRQIHRLILGNRLRNYGRLGYGYRRLGHLLELAEASIHRP